jgi:hypothetical protein
MMCCTISFHARPQSLVHCLCQSLCRCHFVPLCDVAKCFPAVGFRFMSVAQERLASSNTRHTQFQLSSSFLNFPKLSFLLPLLPSASTSGVEQSSQNHLAPYTAISLPDPQLQLELETALFARTTLLESSRRRRRPSSRHGRRAEPSPQPDPPGCAHRRERGPWSRPAAQAAGHRLPHQGQGSLRGDMAGASGSRERHTTPVALQLTHHDDAVAPSLTYRRTVWRCTSRERALPVRPRSVKMARRSWRRNCGCIASRSFKPSSLQSGSSNTSLLLLVRLSDDI